MYKIVSVGGSIIIPQSGFDIAFLKKFKKMILQRVARGDRFILVTGGGALARYYQDTAKKITKLTDRDLDWVGIAATEMNAKLVLRMFKGYTPDKIVTNPTKKLKTDKSIIVASGWKPGCSSDYDAVLLARTYGVKELFNLSNIEYVYDKDPRKFKSAKKIKEIDWASFRKNIVGNKWEAGKNVPFDPIASREAQKLGLKVAILNGKNLAEVEKALSGKSFRGTVISNF